MYVFLSFNCFSFHPILNSVGLPIYSNTTLGYNLVKRLSFSSSTSQFHFLFRLVLEAFLITLFFQYSLSNRIKCMLVPRRTYFVPRRAVCYWSRVVIHGHPHVAIHPLHPHRILTRGNLDPTQ